MIRLEIWMLGVALAMDCLAISLATGMGVRRMVWMPMMTMALCFGIFQGGMTLLGFSGAHALHTLVSVAGPWVAATLLLALGTNMIVEGIRNGHENKPAKIPTLPGTLLLAMATSIDAFAVGVSFACMSMRPSEIAYPVKVIGFCSWAISLAGLAAGIGAARLIKWPTEPIGGVVLIALGCKTIVTELLF